LVAVIGEGLTPASRGTTTISTSATARSATRSRRIAA